MTGFLIAALLLLAAVIATLLWPLLRGARDDSERQSRAVVALFRDKLRDLEAERSAGAIDAGQYELSRRDIERQLVEAVAAVPAPSAAALPRARWSAALVGLFVLFVPVVLYATLGNPDALDNPDAAAPAEGAAQAHGGARPLTSAQVQKMIDGLKDAIKKNPGDAQAWAMLARAQAYERQYAEAERSFTQAVALNPRDARLLADLADAMAMNAGRKLEGEPTRLLERALQIDPTDVKALALMGTAAFDRKQYGKAADYWQRAVDAAPNDQEFAQNLRGSIDEARQLAGGTPTRSAGTAPAASATADHPAPARASSATPGGAGAIRGRVVLAPALAAKAAPTDTVFIFARAAQGPRMPLALLRKQVRDLPAEFTLDDSMAMMADLTISKYAPVIVGARISHSGDAMAAPGDLQGFSKTVPAGTSGVVVTIDQEVRQ